MNNEHKILMRQADHLLQQIGNAEKEHMNTEKLLSLSHQHIQVWRSLAKAGYVPIYIESIPWKWKKRVIQVRWDYSWLLVTAFGWNVWTRFEFKPTTMRPGGMLRDRKDHVLHLWICFLPPLLLHVQVARNGW